MNHIEFKSILFKAELDIAAEKYQAVISTTRDENGPEIEIKHSISLGQGEGEKMVVMERMDRGGLVQFSGRAVGVNENQIGSFTEDWIDTVTDAVFGPEEDDLFYEEEDNMQDILDQLNEQVLHKDEEIDTESDDELNYKDRLNDDNINDKDSSVKNMEKDIQEPKKDIQVVNEEDRQTTYDPAV